MFKHVSLLLILSLTGDYSYGNLICKLLDELAEYYRGVQEYANIARIESEARFVTVSTSRFSRSWGTNHLARGSRPSHQTRNSAGYLPGAGDGTGSSRGNQSILCRASTKQETEAIKKTARFLAVMRGFYYSSLQTSEGSIAYDPTD